MNYNPGQEEIDKMYKEDKEAEELKPAVVITIVPVKKAVPKSNKTVTEKGYTTTPMKKIK